MEQYYKDKGYRKILKKSINRILIVNNVCGLVNLQEF